MTAKFAEGQDFHAVGFCMEMIPIGAGEYFGLTVVFYKTKLVLIKHLGTQAYLERRLFEICSCSNPSVKRSFFSSISRNCSPRTEQNLLQ